MFKGLGNLAGMLKQAQQMGSKLEALNEELKNQRATGTAGGGMVTVETNGAGDVISCRLDPSIIGDQELIEDLIPAAVNQALAKSKQLHAEAMRGLAAGFDLPGLDSALSKFVDPNSAQDAPKE
jgi:DNA-binding YbaB/EbfC family protein